VHQLATDPARDAQLRHLRDSHPVFRIDDARTEGSGGTLWLSFRLSCGDVVFAPSVELRSLRPDEVRNLDHEFERDV
jgi:hypothetical protein